MTSVSASIRNHLFNGAVHRPDGKAIYVLMDALGYTERQIRSALNDLCTNGEINITPSTNFPITISLVRRERFVPQTAEGRRQSLYATTAEGHRLPGTLPDYMVGELHERKAATREEYVALFGTEPPEGLFPVTDNTVEPTPPRKGPCMTTQPTTRNSRVIDRLNLALVAICEMLEKSSPHDGVPAGVMTKYVAKECRISDYNAAKAMNGLVTLQVVTLVPRGFPAQRFVVDAIQCEIDEADVRWLKYRRTDFGKFERAERIVLLTECVRWLLARNPGKPFSLSGYFQQFLGFSKTDAHIQASLIMDAQILTRVSNHGRNGHVYEAGPNMESVEAALEAIRAAEQSRPSAVARTNPSNTSDNPTPDVQPSDSVEIVTIRKDVLDELRQLALQSQERGRHLDSMTFLATCQLTMLRDKDALIDMLQSREPARQVEDLSSMSVEEVLMG